MVATPQPVVREALWWPDLRGPGDLSAVETVPLESRGLPESTYALLTRAAHLWPHRVAISVLPDVTRWQKPLQRTFAQLLAEVHRYANALHRLGIRRTDAVALMAPNCAELITATLAAQLAGVAAPLNGNLAVEHLTHLLSHSCCRTLITAGPELAPDMWATACALAADHVVDTLLVLRPTAATSDPEPLPIINGVRVVYLADLSVGLDPAAFAGTPPAADDLAAVFHTGGTTGLPKLAGHSHANEVVDAWLICLNPLLDSESVVFAAMPLFHVNALLVTVLAPLLAGQHVVWAGPLGYREPGLYERFWAMVEHYRIAVMSGVPTVYASLTAVPVDADISGLRYPLVGAAPLPAAVRTRFREHTGVSLVEGYGLTETTCVTARSFPDGTRTGAAGQRLPYVQVKVVRVGGDGAWHELPAGETGHLAVRGPTVFPGYVIGRDDDGFILDGLGALADGWFETGDLARIDPDGFVHLTGRAKDVIIRGGHNIDPATIEDALLAHPQVTGAGAVGRPDPHAGEVPVAYVTVAHGCDLTSAQLCSWAADAVCEPAAAPKDIVILDALPVTDVGKPYKVALRADAARRAITDALAAFPGVHVDTAVVDGAATVSVRIPAGTDPAAVTDVLDTYSLTWTLDTLR